MNALLLIAHGSRRAEANADLDHLADELRRRGRFGVVVPAFLELAEPDIPTGGDRCVSAGATDVTLLPYFLSPGVHVREDLTAAMAAMAEKHPAVTFRLAEPLGRHPLLVEIVEQRAGEV
jgi:sirohydrochlorin ferrochelatase